MTIETENERAFLCGKNGWMKYFKTDKSKTSMTKGQFSSLRIKGVTFRLLWLRFTLSLGHKNLLIDLLYI